MKLTLTIEYEVDGIAPPDIGQLYASKIPSAILSEDEDGTDSWAILTNNVQWESGK